MAKLDNELGSYITNIREKITANLTYPKGIQEEQKVYSTTVQFTIHSNGEAEEINIVKSSGNSLIDKAVIDSLYKASPFPSPLQVGKTSLQLTIPVVVHPPDSENPIISYQKWVEKRIKKSLIYPLIARRHNWEGIVTLKVKINRSGKVEAVDVAASSGYPLLDKAAVDATYRASPYPFPKFINQPSLTLTIPFNFTLPGKKVETSSASPPPSLGEKTSSSPQMREYIYKVSKQLSDVLVPPEELKEVKETTVEFTIDDKGEAENIKVVKSSGLDYVDKAAKEAVEKASPFESPTRVGRKSLTITVPLQFRPQPLQSVAPHKSSSLSKPSKEKEGTTKYSLLKKSYLPSLIERNDKMFIPEGREELKKLIEIAIKNSKPLEIAKEEMELATLKLKEAKRNLWPSATVGFYHTDGEVYNLDYREQEGKITINQPLYYGGRLTNAVKQADVNIEITKRNYLEKKMDVVNKTEIAYFNLITLHQNLERQKKIVEEAKKILTVIDKQYKNGLVIKLDYNGAHSWYKQLTLQLKSIEQELGLAELSLKQALNTETLPEITDFSLGIKEFDFTLDECVNLALKYRPEIELGKLMVKFYEYARKVEEGKKKFNIDLTASYGYYQGGYETESLRPANNWAVGFRVIKPWGNNTVTGAYNLNKEQPRFGETSPTKTSTFSTELKLLDNYKMKADIKNAEILHLKSITQLEETKKSIAFEVKDTFFKYKKALLELKSALSQKRFREEQLKITRMKALSGEAEFVRLMDVLVQLADADNKYASALGNYYIAIANLKKATGYGLHLPPL